MRDNTENNYGQPNQPDQPQGDGGAEDALEQANENEPHLWDQIFKRIVHDMPKQLLPLIKLAFGKEYPKDTPIKPLATEYPVEQPASGKISSIHTDSTLEVGFDDIYHFECDSSGDGELVIRMFRYDSGVAITYSAKTGGRGGSVPEIKFPHSAVIYVQGKEKLNVLVPFLPLRFRKRERTVNGKKTGEFDLDEGELTDFYERLIMMLKNEQKAGTCHRMSTTCSSSC